MTGRPLRRNWDNVTLAGWCQVCGAGRDLQRAHLIGRARDQRVGPKTAQVANDEVVTLCRSCHVAYDAHGLDLYPFLAAQKLAGAIRAAGGPGHALRRLMGAAWRTAPQELITKRLAALTTIHAQDQETP